MNKTIFCTKPLNKPTVYYMQHVIIIINFYFYWSKKQTLAAQTISYIVQRTGRVTLSIKEKCTLKYNI